MTKTCVRCGLEQPIENFYLRGGRYRTRQSYCKSCQKLVNQSWELRHPGNNIERCRRWRAKHPGYFIHRDYLMARERARKWLEPAFGDDWESHWKGFKPNRRSQQDNAIIGL
jgi:NMD protein affecting ribosome stability and mRNA decay